MPKLSVCIPAYNQIEHLKKTIDSVLCQTFSDYEIIITDDSSSNIIKDFIAENYPGDKIKYFKNEPQLGSPENWNEAIRKSSGEYIKILHHDDWLNFNDSLAKYVALLDENPEVDFAFSATQAINPGIKNWVHEITIEQLNSIKSNPLILYCNNLIGAPSTGIFRKKSNLIFDRNLKWLVDIEYYIRQLSQNKNIAYSSEMLVVTYLAEGRVTDECVDNKEVEVFEYLYVLNSIFKRKNGYDSAALKSCLIKAIDICDKYKINNVQQIADCGYTDRLDNRIKIYLTLKSISSTLGKIYLKLLRNK